MIPAGENYMAEYSRGWRAELKRRRRAELLVGLREALLDFLIACAIVGAILGPFYVALFHWKP